MPIVKDREAYHVESTLSRRPREENKSVEAGIPNKKHLWKEEDLELAAPLEGSAPSTQIL